MNKKYLVTEEFVKSDLKPGVIDRESGFLETSREELDPAGRWLTRKQFREAATRCAGDGFYQEFDWQELDKVENELFGPEEEK